MDKKFFPVIFTACHRDNLCDTILLDVTQFRFSDMLQIGIRQMRAALSRLDELLAREGEIVITRHGKAIGRLLPPESNAPPPSHADLRAAMPRLEVGSEVLLRQDREQR